MRYVKKSVSGVFLGEKSTRLVLQKHANRTVHPSKIEDVLPMVQRLRIAIFGGSRCPEKKYVFFGRYVFRLVAASLGLKVLRNTWAYWYS